MLKRGPLCVLACCVMWGLLPVFWKQLAAINSVCVLAYRVIGSLFFAGVILMFQHGKFAGVRKALQNRRELFLLIIAGMLITVNWGLYIWAVASNHTMDSSLAYYMNPILTVLLGVIVFRERLNPLRWMAVAVTFMGLIITVIRYGRIPWLALGIGGTFAAYGAIKKSVQSDSLTASFVESATVAPVALIVIFFMEFQGMGAFSVLQGGRLLLLPTAGIVSTIPLLCFAIGMRTTPMTLSGNLMYINPTLQLLVSVWLFHEEFTKTHAILFAFVWGGLSLYLLAGRLDHRKEIKMSCV